MKNKRKVEQDGMSHTDFTGNKLFGSISLAFWFGKKTTSAKFLYAAQGCAERCMQALFYFILFY